MNFKGFNEAYVPITDCRFFTIYKASAFSVLKHYSVICPKTTTIVKTYGLWKALSRKIVCDSSKIGRMSYFLNLKFLKCLRRQLCLAPLH